MTSEERALDCWVTRPILPQEEFMVRHIAATIDAAVAASLASLLERFRQEAAECEAECRRLYGLGDRYYEKSGEFAAYRNAVAILETRMKEGR